MDVNCSGWNENLTFVALAAAALWFETFSFHPTHNDSGTIHFYQPFFRVLNNFTRGTFSQLTATHKSRTIVWSASSIATHHHIEWDGSDHVYKFENSIKIFLFLHFKINLLQSSHVFSCSPSHPMLPLDRARWVQVQVQVLISTLLLKIWILSDPNVILSLLCSMIFLSFVVLFLFSVDLRPSPFALYLLEMVQDWFRMNEWMYLFEPIIITIMQWPRSWIKGQSRISLLTLQTSGDQLIQRSMFSISISIFSDVCWWLDAVQ